MLRLDDILFRSTLLQLEIVLIRYWGNGDLINMQFSLTLSPLWMAAFTAALILSFPLQVRSSWSRELANDSNLSVDAAIDAAVPRKTFSSRMKSQDILFITNREVDYSAGENAYQSGSVLHWEDVFKKKPAIAISYGRATVSYPANRKRGDQNYLSGSAAQNPLFNFSVVNCDLLSLPDDFQNLVGTMYPENKQQPALLYVHGIADSFSDAAERLAQLVIDTDYSGNALLFSWPSDDWNTLFPPTPGDYEKAFQSSRASRLYLVHSLGELAEASNGTLSVLAHSMGTDIATNAIVSRKLLAQTNHLSLSETIRTLV